MSTPTYLVTCDLATDRFDDPRDGFAAADAAFLEVRHLGRLDQRVRSTSLHRRGDTVRISVTMSARTHREAFDLGRAIVRTAVHATGGATHGWEALEPTVGASQRTTRRLRSRRGAVPAPVDTRQDWAAVSAAAQSRIAAAGPLPPLTEVVVVDLRRS